jgi:hypothetical protein
MSKRSNDEDEEKSSIPLVSTGRTAKEKYLEKSLEETKSVRISQNFCMLYNSSYLCILGSETIIERAEQGQNAGVKLVGRKSNT